MHELRWCWLAFMVICTARIIYTDCRWYWIPDGAVVMTAFGNAAACLWGFVAVQWEVWAGIVAFFFCIYGLSRGGMGSGDVKLSAALALGCSGYTACVMVVASFLSALAGAACLSVWTRKKMVPFAPFLWLGWWCAQLFGQYIWQQVTRWAGDGTLTVFY